MKWLGRAFARLRGRSGRGVPGTASPGARTETAITVVAPWRSSTSWDEYDLRVYPRRSPDRFHFYAEVGNPVSVRAEARLPGPGLRVRVLCCEPERELLVQACSDEHGVADLFMVARVGGTHSVEVELDPPKSERPQSYRLSIDSQRTRRPADGMRRRRAEFVDVPVGHPYRETIVAVAGADVMTGDGDWWEFAPDDPVTRVQFAEMIRDALGSEGSGAVPVLLADLAAQDRLKGVLQVVPRVGDRPVPAIARAQAVSSIVGAMERYHPGLLQRPPRGFSCTMASGVHRFHARIAEYNGLLQGLVGFGPQWDPRLALSRGEAAEMLWAMMRLAGTSGEELPAAAAPGPSEGTDDGGEPDLAALGVYTSEYILDTQEEIDRLMAEPGPAEGSPSRTEVPPSIRPLAVDPADMRQSVERTRDRLKAKSLDSKGPAEADTPAQETDASTARQQAAEE